MKRQVTEWVRISVIHIFIEEVIPGIQKSYKSIREKTNDSTVNWAEDFSRHFTVEDIQMANNHSVIQQDTLQNG